MGIIADTSLVSNKVFTAIQPWQNYEEHTGTVIYANKYADVAEVPMPKDIRAILDSDAGSVGNNPLIQLQGKLQYLGDGPWYTDCRNGMLYIHNKKFREDSIHTYVYQSENGEVLRVSFETQLITHHDLAKAMNIDPRTGESLKSDLSEKVKDILKDLKVWGVERPDATANRVGYGYNEPIKTGLWGGGDLINGQWYHRNKELRNPQITFQTDAIPDYKDRNIQLNAGARNNAIINDLESQELRLNGLSESDRAKGEVMAKYDKQSQADRDRYAANAARTLIKNKKRREVLSDKRFGGKYPTYKHDQEWVEDQINWRSAEAYEDMSAEAGDVIRESREKKRSSEETKNRVQAVVEKYINVGSTHFYSAPAFVVEWVDPTTYSGNNTFKDKAMYSRHSIGDVHNRTMYKKATSKMDAMMNDPNIAVYSDLVKEPIPGTKTNQYRYKIQIRHPAYRKVELSAVDNVTDWLLRSGNAALDAEEKKKAENNKLANASVSRVDKVLVVKMDVVGRPSLTNSKVLTLLNVGKRWSGKYYVIECTHKMDASEGYICSMDLSKNAGKPGAEIKNEKLSSNHIIKENASENNEHNKNRGITVTKSKPAHSKSVTVVTAKPSRSSSPKRKKNRKSSNHSKRNSTKRR